MCRAQKTHRAVNVAREAALAFLEADTNGDGVLEWSEFLEAIARMRKLDSLSLPSLSDESSFRASTVTAATFDVRQRERLLAAVQISELHTLIGNHRRANVGRAGHRTWLAVSPFLNILCCSACLGLFGRA